MRQRDACKKALEIKNKSHFCSVEANGGISICLRSGRSEKPSLGFLHRLHRLCTSCSWTIKAIGFHFPQQPPQEGMTLTKRLRPCAVACTFSASFGLPFEIKLRLSERKAVEPFVADSLWFVSLASCAVNILTRNETKIYKACINLLAIWFIAAVANGFESFEKLQQRNRVVSSAGKGVVASRTYFQLTMLLVSRPRVLPIDLQTLNMFTGMFVAYFISEEDSTRHAGLKSIVRIFSLFLERHRDLVTNISPRKALHMGTVL